MRHTCGLLVERVEGADDLVAVAHAHVAEDGIDAVGTRRRHRHDVRAGHRVARQGFHEVADVVGPVALPSLDDGRCLAAAQIGPREGADRAVHDLS